MFVHARRQELLSAYHDGELAPGLAQRVEEHMDRCAACRDEYRALARVANAVRHLRREEAPVGLAAAIRRRIDEEIHGMVPILRGELLSCRRRPVLVPALSLAAVLTLSLVALLFLLDGYRPGARFDAIWARGSLAPIPLQVEMTSPRFRDDSVNLLPMAEVEQGKEGTLLTLASIDHNGYVNELEVLYRSGDEEMLARALEVVRASGFEPARLGEQTVPVHFLYLFTTMEVRSRKRIT